MEEIKKDNFSEVREEREKAPSKNRWSAFLIALMFLIILLLVGYIAYQKGYIKFTLNPAKQEKEVESKTEEKKEEIKQEEVKQEEQETIKSSVYNGKYLTAKVPEGWDISEYIDSEGSAQTSVPLKGLTELTIYKGEGYALSFKGIYGIGFEGCPELPHFEDSSSAYEKEQNGYNEEIYGPIKYTNYKNSDYDEFTLLGQRVRLVGTKLFYDTIPNNNYFEPQCASAFMNLNCLGYTGDGTNKISSYTYNFAPNLTDQDIQELIYLLSSIKVK